MHMTSAMHRQLWIVQFTLLAAIVLARPVAAGENPWVEMQTTKGTIIIELFPDEAPLTVRNFLDYITSGFYDGTIIHRAVYDWVIQGGGYDRAYQYREAGEPVTNEANNGLKNVRGTVAMARYEDPDSAAAQFFINLDNNESLDHKGENDGDWGYCVFGQVIKGLEIADGISQMEKEEIGHIGLSVPVGPVIIERMQVLQDTDGDSSGLEQYQ